MTLSIHRQHVPEDGGISLHGLLHIQPNLGGRERTSGVADVVEELDALEASILGDLLVGLSRLEGLLDVVGASTAKDDDVQERVGTKTVSTVDTTRNLTSGEQSENGLVSRSEYARLRVDLETAHGVVEDRGHDCDVEVVIHAEVGVLEELLAEGFLLRLRL